MSKPLAGTEPADEEVSREEEGGMLRRLWKGERRGWEKRRMEEERERMEEGLGIGELIRERVREVMFGDREGEGEREGEAKGGKGKGKGN